MHYQTVAAAFDSRSHAQAAVDALKTAGFHPSDISLIGKEIAPESSLWRSKSPAIWQRLFGRDIVQHEAAVYHTTVDKGGAVVSVRVPDHEVAHATGILDLHHPIDVTDRAMTTGVVPAGRVQSVAASRTTAPVTTSQTIAVPMKLAQASEKLFHLAEEQLKFGKRMIETGKTRVRRFVTDRNVSADVTLHEEHAEVMRRSITDPTYLADVDWADSAIDVVETADQALVNKTARVVEELSTRKSAGDHVQTLREKIRHQQVEVERYGADEPTAGGTRTPTAEPSMARTR